MKKKIILFVMLLIGGITLSSCNKENNDSADLEGTWVVYDGELLFDGSVVLNGDNAMESNSYGSFTFSDGYVSIMSEDGGGLYPYTANNDIITITSYIFPIQMKIKKLTKLELVLDMLMPNAASADLSGGEKVATYKGKAIYRSDNSYIFDVSYWYISGSKFVICTPIDEDDFSRGWVDTFRFYLKKLTL